MSTHQEEAMAQGRGELTRVNKLAQEFLKETTSFLKLI
jgi:hypothetical protein